MNLRSRFLFQSDDHAHLLRFLFSARLCSARFCFGRLCVARLCSAFLGSLGCYKKRLIASRLWFCVTSGTNPYKRVLVSPCHRMPRISKAREGPSEWIQQQASARRPSNTRINWADSVDIIKWTSTRPCPDPLSRLTHGEGTRTL